MVQKVKISWEHKCIQIQKCVLSTFYQTLQLKREVSAKTENLMQISHSEDQRFF